MLRPADFFVLRSPLLPFASLDGLDRERMRALVARPDVREALFLASPGLEESLPHWLAAPDSERGEKVEASLLRYLSRLAARATPFGLFAGCAVGRVGGVGEATALELDAADSARRHTRLDMDYVCALVDKLAADPAIRARLRHRVNSSLYRAGGRLHYAEARLGSGSGRSYHLVAVGDGPELAAALKRAEGEGARPDEIAAAIVAVDAEIALDDARAFVDELIDAQLLVSALEPAVTGPPPLAALIENLGDREEARVLRGVGEALAGLDDTPPGAPPALFRGLAAELGALPAPVEMSRLFQVDMRKHAGGAVLGAEVVATISRGVQLLHRLAGTPTEDALSRFRDAYRARYEAREMPLAEVLDEEVGIGFEAASAIGAEGSPLLEGLAFPARGNEGGVPFGRRETLLLRHLRRVWSSASQELVLTDKDVDELAAGRTPRPLPGSFAVMATLAHAPDQIFLHFAGGPSGANLLGRFCHADPRLETAVRRSLADEEALAPDAIFAEIVHLPQGRVGNVLARPLLRGHEIAYLGRSGAPVAQQISLEDLRVSVEGERVVLRSARLGKEVVPRLTTAHNFSSPQNLGVYRFLCALKGQGVTGGVAWSWGALDAAELLPRVRHGALVLARARWRVAGKDVAAGVDTLRERLGLPRWIEVADGDNELPFDLDSALGREGLRRLIGKRGEALLVEMWPTPERLACRGPEGAYTHELVLPFTAGEPALGRTIGAIRSESERAFAPGSSWLYAKLYAGPGRCDHLLREIVAPLARGSEGWFFLRYGDPDWHLRVRLRGVGLDKLHDATREALAAGVLHKLVVDTYFPEVERYGGAEGLQLAERLFQADSEAALALIERLHGDELAAERWKLALVGMDRLLADLGFDVKAKLSILERCRAGFAREFRVDGGFEKLLGERFRKHRKELETRLQEDGFGEVWQARSERLSLVTAGLRAASLDVPLAQIAESYLHMHANRLLRSAARAQELVLYDFLVRLYTSQLARQNRVTKSK